MRVSRLLSSFLVLVIAMLGAEAPKPTQQGLMFSKTAQPALTMDYYAGAGVGARPVAILIPGVNANQAYGADVLVAAGYDVFALRYSGAIQQPGETPVQNVERAVRYVRFHARDWNADGRKIALIGGSDGAYLSTMAGLINSSGVMGSDDAVDRESARVEAVVAVFDVSEFAGSRVNAGIRALLDPIVQEKVQEAALARAYVSNYVDPNAPAFLVIGGNGGDSDMADVEQALKKTDVRCDVVRLPNGTAGTNVPDWQHTVSEWLNKTLSHEGTIGAAMRMQKRIPG